MRCSFFAIPIVYRKHLKLLKQRIGNDCINYRSGKELPAKIGVMDVITWIDIEKFSLTGTIDAGVIDISKRDTLTLCESDSIFKIPLDRPRSF